MKIHVVHVSVDNGGRVYVSDRKGRLWERNDRMPLGEWGAVELPDEPRPKRRRKRP